MHFARGDVRNHIYSQPRAFFADGTTELDTAHNNLETQPCQHLHSTSGKKFWRCVQSSERIGAVAGARAKAELTHPSAG